MHQQLWGYKVEWKSVPRGMGGKKVEYHCNTGSGTMAVSSYQLCCIQSGLKHTSLQQDSTLHLTTRASLKFQPSHIFITC